MKASRLLVVAFLVTACSSPQQIHSAPPVASLESDRFEVRRIDWEKVKSVKDAVAILRFAFGHDASVRWPKYPSNETEKLQAEFAKSSSRLFKEEKK